LAYHSVIHSFHEFDLRLSVFFGHNSVDRIISAPRWHLESGRRLSMTGINLDTVCLLLRVIHAMKFKDLQAIELGFN
jgi:hypothetical protein